MGHLAAFLVLTSRQPAKISLQNSGEKSRHTSQESSGEQILPTQETQIMCLSHLGKKPLQVSHFRAIPVNKGPGDNMGIWRYEGSPNSLETYKLR